MKIHPSLTVERVQAAAENDEEYLGFCIKCGEEAYGVEPDARRYKCEACGAKMVYGAQEILLMFIGL